MVVLIESLRESSLLLLLCKIVPASAWQRQLWMWQSSGEVWWGVLLHGSLLAVGWLSLCLKQQVL